MTLASNHVVKCDVEWNFQAQSQRLQEASHFLEEQQPTTGNHHDVNKQNKEAKVIDFIRCIAHSWTITGHTENMHGIYWERKFYIHRGSVERISWLLHWFASWTWNQCGMRCCELIGTCQTMLWWSKCGICGRCVLLCCFEGAFWHSWTHYHPLFDRSTCL